jgi:hypothetical protein
MQNQRMSTLTRLLQEDAAALMTVRIAFAILP